MRNSTKKACSEQIAIHIYFILIAGRFIDDVLFDAYIVYNQFACSKEKGAEGYMLVTCNIKTS